MTSPGEGAWPSGPAEPGRQAPSAPPVFGHPSPAAERPAALRAAASSADAAYRAEGGDGGPWRVRAATVAGVRHRLDGRGGQDAFAWAELPVGLVVAVADGVSATPRAALAARVAAAAACRGAGAPGTGAPTLDPPGRSGGDATDCAAAPLGSCAAAAVEAARRAVAEAVGGPETGAATLVVAVVGSDGRWAASRVGDSEALVLDRGWHDVFPPPGGDDGLRSGATEALPVPEAPRQDAAGRLAAGAALVLLTDGVAGPLRDGPATVAVGLAEGLAQVPRPLELAALADFARQGCHDDRTLLAVWFTGGAET